MVMHTQLLWSDSVLKHNTVTHIHHWIENWGWYIRVVKNCYIYIILYIASVQLQGLLFTLGSFLSPNSSIVSCAIWNNFSLQELRVIPVHWIEQLHHLFVSPVWRENKKIQSEWCHWYYGNGEWQILLDIFPLHENHVIQITFEGCTAVKKVN